MVRPIIMCYDLECMVVDKRVSVVEMRILSWMSQVTSNYRIMNKYVRDDIGLASKVYKMREYTEGVWHVIRKTKMNGSSVQQVVM